MGLRIRSGKTVRRWSVLREEFSLKLESNPSLQQACRCLRKGGYAYQADNRLQDVLDIAPANITG